MGAVLTDRVIAEHLSPIHVFLERSLEQGSMLYLAARSLSALRECIQELPEYWQQIASRISVLDNPSQITSSHPRFYPYPSSYIENSKTIHFQYVRRLERDDAKLSWQKLMMARRSLSNWYRLMEQKSTTFFITMVMLQGFIITVFFQTTQPTRSETISLLTFPISRCIWWSWTTFLQDQSLIIPILFHS